MFHCLGDAEIAQVDVPIGVEEDVGRFDVAMHVSLMMDKIQCLGDVRQR